jgi:hypothetical protein
MSGNQSDTNPSKLGGGLPGGQPRGGLLGGGAGSTGGSGMTGSSIRGQSRKVLRLAFGNHTLPGRTTMITPTSLGPFRKAMNAGDLNGTINTPGQLSYGASNQVNNVRGSSLAGYQRSAGHVSNGGAAFTGNPRYVYDGGDYTRFKKLQAQNRNYNDSSFGGPAKGKSSTTFVALGRVRH